MGFIAAEGVASSACAVAATNSQWAPKYWLFVQLRRKLLAMLRKARGCAWVVCGISIVSCFSPPPGVDSGVPTDSGLSGDAAIDGGRGDNDGGDAGDGGTQADFVICPTGDLSSDCDFLGAAGIQQAANEALVATFLEPTVIVIRAGDYGFATLADFPQVTQIGDERFFLDTQSKHLKYIAEGVVRIDGTNSIPMHGFRIRDGSLTLEGLRIEGLHPNNLDACKMDFALPGCGLGGNTVIALGTASIALIRVVMHANRHGLQLNDTCTALVRGLWLSEHWYYGLYLSGNSSVQVEDSVFVRSQQPVVLLDRSSAQIFNNTFVNNRIAAINAHSCSDENQPSTVSVNNIIVGTAKNMDGTFGYAIGGGCLAEDLSRQSYSYNLFWQNAGDGANCDVEQLCGNATTIKVDPLFVNPSQDDYRLQEGSPARNTGDPGRQDPDGSPSDMGARL